ncbi:hypothetical protein NA57DRAFT_64375 [Rhizodiscina lignyota]|uniref:Arginine N-methyltransferase 2 n=1 Tax=Rhizodiscina lignyota TaxID=1504668 RepID=A0A9P4IIB2_9PEZI|nr:hypothetical protein NA57DRAFT_64375 [Rhizodiscina lignyota]
MTDPAFMPDVDIQTQEILLASSQHDIPKLRALLRNTNANVRDSETGFTPLHAAIASCELDEPELVDTNGEANGTVNGTNGAEVTNDSGSERDKALADAAETVRFLFQHGATWNEVDTNGETPGCMARRLGLKEIYEMIVDQGVRAELLLTRLDQYEVLLDDEAEEEKDEAAEGPGTAGGDDPVQFDTSAADDMNDAVVAAAETFTVPSNALLSNEALLKSIWTRTAELVLPKSDLRLLSVEPSLDLLSALQLRQPAKHHVIASDPTIFQAIQNAGWLNKEDQGVIIHRDAWTGLLPQFMSEGWPDASFDAIYFSTSGHALRYGELRTFFSEWAEQLLATEGGEDGQGGLLTFFHGVGAERQVMYDVYTKILEMDLFEASFDTEWEHIPVPDIPDGGHGTGNEPRWRVETYRLPICRLVD